MPKPHVHIILEGAPNVLPQELNEFFNLHSYSNLAEVPGDNNDPKLLLKPTEPIIYFADHLPFSGIEEDLKPLKISDYQQIKRQPVLFMVSKTKCMEIAGLVHALDDVLPSDSATEDIIFKLNQLIERSNSDKKLKRDLNEASDIALLSMSHSSELGEISRFILSSYDCLIYESLFEALFKTVSFFGLDCTALITVGDTITVASSKGSVLREDKDLILKYHRSRRIITLPNELIVSHDHSSILIHEVGDVESARTGRLADNMAVLGNCFDARVRGIETEQQALAAGRAKTMFLATMSHELRTPMNAVLGNTSRLMKKLDGRLNEREEKQLDAIRRNGDHLLSLINDILDLSKIEVGQMEVYPERTNIIALLKNIFDQLFPLSKTSNLTFDLILESDELEIDVDAKRFTQMVMNLVSNGLKYTKEGGVKIVLSCVHDKQVGEAVSVSIQDTGIGISEEDQKKLFGNFIQIDSALTRTVEGSGLGLAISAFFAKRHDGRIKVESELGVGSNFTLILPRPAC